MSVFKGVLKLLLGVGMVVMIFFNKFLMLSLVLVFILLVLE